MADYLKLAKTDAPPQRGGFVRTETADDILRSLTLVRQLGGPALTMIAGAPGVGKTEALKHFVSQNEKNCILIQAVCGEGTPWNFANSLARIWGYARPTFNSVEDARTKLARYIGPQSMLIVDEAQYLNQKNRRGGGTGEALEWLRGMAEAGGFPLVLCGDLTLVTAVAAMPQLESRMRRPVVVQKPSRKDVEAIERAEGFDDPEAARALSAVAGLRGGLRNVENVIRMARMFAEGEPGLTHLKAAMIDMKISSKGARS